MQMQMQQQAQANAAAAAAVSGALSINPSIPASLTPPLSSSGGASSAAAMCGPLDPNAWNDWFDRLCQQKRSRLRLGMAQRGETSMASLLFKLGRKVPTWKERYCELNRHGTVLRYYARSDKMIEIEPLYKELKRRVKLTPRDLDTKAKLDRLAAQREKLRTSLLRGQIVIEPGRTQVTVPNADRKYVTAFVFEIVTPSRSLLACAPDSDTRDEWIAIIRARAAKLSIDHHRGGIGGRAEHSILAGLPHLESRLQQQLRMLRAKNISNLTKTFMENLARKQARFLEAGGVLEPSAAVIAASPRGANAIGDDTRDFAVGGGASASKSSPAGPAPLSLAHALLVCEHLRTSLALHTFKKLFVSYPHCFSGRDATHYCVQQSLCDSLSTAVALCALMLQHALILNVSNAKDAPFRNDPKAIYTFPKHSMLHDMGAAGRAQMSAGAAAPQRSVLDSMLSSVSGGACSDGLDGGGSGPGGLLLPSEEERVIVSRMREELDVRDRSAGLFSRTYKDCFVARDAVAWLIDRGVCPNDSAAVRLCTRLLRTSQILPVSFGGSSASLRDACFDNSGDLYKFHAAVQPMASSRNLLALDTPRKPNLRKSKFSIA